MQFDPALFSIRQAIPRTTKYSPFQISYGRLPAEMKLKEIETPKEATDKIVENLMKYRKTLHDMVEENIKHVQTKRKKIMEEKLLPRIHLHMRTLCIEGIAENCKGNSQS